MPEQTILTPLVRLARLKRHDTAFELVPDAEARRALADTLGLLDLRKLRLSGRISPDDAQGWRLDAMLGATVVQPCVITLDPVTTRLDEAITRRYSPDAEPGDSAPEEEFEMPEDDTLEPLPEVLDLNALLAEALVLALPHWPRSAGAELGTLRTAPEGVTPLENEETRPFAGLAELRERLTGKNEKDGSDET